MMMKRQSTPPTTPISDAKIDEICPNQGGCGEETTVVLRGRIDHRSMVVQFGSAPPVAIQTQHIV
jgi:hypothetical protein